MSTKDASDPNREKCFSTRPRLGPYTDAVLTMCAPCPSIAMYSVLTAPRPELVAMPPTPFSSTATLSSNAAMVGFPIRV